MSRDSQPTEAMTATQINSSSSQASNKDFFSAFIGILYSLWLSFGKKLRHTGVTLGTFLYEKAFVPTAVFVIGLWTALAKRATIAKHKVMCWSHEIAVKIARVKAHRLTSVLVITSLMVLVITSTYYSLGLEISIDGKPVGYVMNESDFNENLSTVEQRVSEILERPYGINSNITFSLGVVERDKLLNDNQLRQVLFSQVSEISELYVLTVDNEVIGASKNQETLQNMLNELLGTSDPNLTGEFTRDVQITKKMMDSSYIRSYDEMRAKLTSNIHEEKTHVIQPGDTLEKIAKEYGTTKAQILEINEGLDPGKLMAGQTIVVTERLPFLPVKQTRRVEYVEEIPFETVEMDDPTQFKGNTTVKVNGSKGQQKVVADVVYENNKEVSRQIISSEIIRQPVKRIVFVGTKTPPAKVATGVFRRPTVGAYISSDYGYRRREFHTGVDFAVAYGSPVYASDGGTVSFAGWKGDYGYLVIINHGNGIQTYYGHNSKLLVHAGQKVAKGDQIAKIGSTGRSTGPHCHFEVRVNGKHVSPWRYIS